MQRISTFLRNHVLGILLMGVLASLIATIVYDALTRTDRSFATVGAEPRIEFDEDRVSPSAARHHIAFISNKKKACRVPMPEDSSRAQFDPKGRVVGVIDALGNVTSFTYDAADNLISTEDPRGNIVTCAYDANNRIIAVIDAQGVVTEFSYDDFGNIASATIGQDQTFRYNYDSQGKITGIESSPSAGANER